MPLQSRDLYCILTVINDDYVHLLYGRVELIIDFFGDIHYNLQYTPMT